ncbi:hypothetical protein AVEN_33585-1 [Araneus ventricosus]|uniref:Uncharacterized protein n=1 Tax=Araneus ventricosus TaxID=182803 RepID=A0A4Y2SLV9_ARAVE|nr:hypothetical protein AVEN_33585-1 [Araneus ventricosus]
MACYSLYNGSPGPGAALLNLLWKNSSGLVLKHLGLWRVAILHTNINTVNVRKDILRHNLQSALLSEEELSWDKEVNYLGLILDSNFPQPSKYNTDKFWAK